MPASGESRERARTVGSAAGIAAFGLLAALAAGAVATAGAELLLPGSLDIDSATGALRRAAGFGLASLLVDVPSADVVGGAAPLTGGLAAFVAIGSSVRTRAWPSGRPTRLAVAAVTATCGALCALAAVLTTDAGVGASPVIAAANGLILGLAASTAGAGAAERDARPPSDPAAHMAARARARSLRALVAVPVVLVAAWLLVAGAAALVTGSLGPKAFVGAALVTVAFAPNIIAALVALGCGGRVELAFAADGSSPALVEGAALWDWHGGVAPPYVLALVLVPLVATVAAAAAAASPDQPPLRRGLRNGIMLGIGLFVLGSVGSYETAAPGAGATRVRFGVDAAAAGLLGLAWGVAGSFVERWLRHAFPRPRVERR
ncbi:MAG TPA: hypothetical protein VG318_08410 [Actinomycetota bacterium]|nr:hypothetical protein [Actinomycetota bacterium]